MTFQVHVKNQDGAPAAGQVVRLQVLNGGPGDVRVTDGGGYAGPTVPPGHEGQPVLITSEGSAGYGTSPVEAPGVDWLRVTAADQTVQIAVVPFA